MNVVITNLMIFSSGGGREKMKTIDDMKMVKLEFFFITTLLGHTLIKLTHSVFGSWTNPSYRHHMHQAIHCVFISNSTICV